MTRRLTTALSLCLLTSAAAAQAPGPALLGEARALQREATVVAVDAARNRITLKSTRGELTLPLAPGVARASDFRPGQVVDVSYDVLVLALSGVRPAAGAIRAKIMDIDRASGRVALQGESGNILVGQASPAVLADIQVGQRVSVVPQITAIGAK